ncbi:Protein transport protein sec20 [Ceratocystis pirilliformis]|uniref:Protein transport protein sec20 n=1 Tax=Ceratocystis pirilliformis TaxID=259994 RepID=A0ABR3ZNB4_9PEZI
MSTVELQERLVALQETTLQLRELIDRLASLKFEPGSVPLNVSEENSISGELSTEISHILREEEDELEILSEEVEDLPESSKPRLKDGVEMLHKELAGCRIAFRHAQISARKSLADAQRHERQLLISVYSQPESAGSSQVDVSEDHQRDTLGGIHPHTEKPSSLLQKKYTALSNEDQQTVSSSTDVTLALRRTHDMIAAELARSEYAHQTLVESSQTLAQLNESYGSLEGMLTSSKDLLGTLLRSQKSDTWYLQTSFYMLLSTLAWLVFRRFLYGPTWWLVWLPLRLILGTGWIVGKTVVPVGKQPAGVESADVSIGQKAEVEGLPSEDLPTVSIVTETGTNQNTKNEDMAAETESEDLNASEKVKKIIDNRGGVEIRLDEARVVDEDNNVPETIVKEEPIQPDFSAEEVRSDSLPDEDVHKRNKDEL